jgi:hypothetical protein
VIEQSIVPEPLWPTPTLRIRHANCDELNLGLRRIILQKEGEILAAAKPTPVAGVEAGLTANWLEYNVLNWDYPEIAVFRKMVLSGLREYFKLVGNPDDPGLAIAGVSCWANVLRHGEYLAVHHHDPGFVSAHYTVHGGSEKGAEAHNLESGHTIYFRPGFMDRSHGGAQAGPTSPWDTDWRISVRPTPGTLYFFPSYVRHEVRPNLEGAERISIAMDVYVKRQNSFIHFGGRRWFVPRP